MSKRRFGISIPGELADRIDQLASKLDIDRSTLITEVLREFMHDRIHILKPHYCKGALIIVSKERHASSLSEIYEEYQEIIKARMHCHADGECIDLLFIKAHSSEILEFKRKLYSLKAVRIRYMPVSWSEDEDLKG